MYRFRTKNKQFIWLHTHAFAFANPFSNEIEYIVCTSKIAQHTAEKVPEKIVEHQGLQSLKNAGNIHIPFSSNSERK